MERIARKQNHHFYRINIQKWQFELPFSIYKFTFQNSVSISVSYSDSVNFLLQFHFLRQRDQSKTQTSMEIRFLPFVCECWIHLSAKLAANINWLRRKWGVAKQIWLTNDVFQKMLWMARVSLHYFFVDEVKPHVDFFTFTRVFELFNIYISIRHTQFEFRLSFALSYGMLKRWNEASTDYSGWSL